MRNKRRQRGDCCHDVFGHWNQNDWRCTDGALVDRACHDVPQTSLCLCFAFLCSFVCFESKGTPDNSNRRQNALLLLLLVSLFSSSFSSFFYSKQGHPRPFCIFLSFFPFSCACMRVFSHNISPMQSNPNTQQEVTSDIPCFALLNSLTRNGVPTCLLDVVLPCEMPLDDARHIPLLMEMARQYVAGLLRACVFAACFCVFVFVRVFSLLSVVCLFVLCCVVRVFCFFVIYGIF